MNRGDAGTAAIEIRPARGREDRAFMLGLIERLAGVISVPHHDRDRILSFQAQFTSKAIGSAGEHTITVLAVEGGTRLGFLHAEPGTDGISGEPCGYVTLLAVTAEAEGRGIARRLVEAAEDWARAAGYRLLSLDVFASNDRGRAFYDRLGFVPETTRLVKALG